MMYDVCPVSDKCMRCDTQGLRPFRKLPQADRAKLQPEKLSIHNSKHATITGNNLRTHDSMFINIQETVSREFHTL